MRFLYCLEQESMVTEVLDALILLAHLLLLPTDAGMGPASIRLLWPQASHQPNEHMLRCFKTSLFVLLRSFF